MTSRTRSGTNLTVQGSEYRKTIVMKSSKILMRGSRREIGRGIRPPPPPHQIQLSLEPPHPWATFSGSVHDNNNRICCYEKHHKNYIPYSVSNPLTAGRENVTRQAFCATGCDVTNFTTKTTRRAVFSIVIQLTSWKYIQYEI